MGSSETGLGTVARTDVGGGRNLRVAFFGGSFDPPHRGHVAIAYAAARAFALDTVLFAPAARQPLKAAGTSAGYADRLAMATLAATLRPEFGVSDLDAPRADELPNYTVETLARLRCTLPETAQIFALVGADSFLSLPKWRAYQELLRLAEWVVVSRPGYSLADLSELPLSVEERARVHVLDGIAEDVSATELRLRLAAGEDCTELIPGPVWAYIAEHGLYRPSA